MSAYAASPEVILLPGLDGTARMFDDFAARLGERGVQARPVSYPPDPPLGYDALEPLVVAQLPEDRPFVLLAESFSGPLALRIASRAPRGLMGLVLSTTFASSPLPWLRPWLGLATLAPARLPMAVLSPLLFGRWATPRLKAELSAALDSVAPATLRARAVAALNVDESERLTQIHVPVLCLQATDDRLLGPGSIQALEAGLPNCQIQTIEGPHLLLQTAAASGAHAVAEFISQLPLRA